MDEQGLLVDRSKQPPTLRDIAARVDVATVSRALNGGSGVSKKRTYQIQAVAKAMGYRPKPLRSKITNAIGLVVCAVDHESPNPGYLERMIYHVEVGAMNIGKHLHLHMLQRGEGGEWPPFIRENRVDGVLVLGHASARFYSQLHDEPIAAVSINDMVARTGIDSVLCDPAPGVQDAIQRLLALGHRAIGLVLTRREFPTVNKRYDAYMQAMRQAGIEPDPQWIVQDMPLGLRGGQRAIRTYIAGNTMPTAVIFNDDWLAMGGVYELANHGLRVPSDVSVVGYDNTAISEELTPSLCSIDNCEKQLVAQSLQMLQQRIEGFSEPPREQIFSSRLVWRESCASVREQSRQ